MKREYKCITSWAVENPDGTKVEIFPGDKVSVTVDTNKVSLNLWGRGQLENPIDFRVVSLSKMIFVGEMLKDTSTYFKLRPNEIVEITKL